MKINIFLSLSITVNRRMYAGKDPSQLSQLAPSCTAYHNHLSMFQLFFMYLNTAMRCKIELLSLTVWGKLPKNLLLWGFDLFSFSVIFSNVWIFLSASPEIWSYALSSLSFLSSPSARARRACALRALGLLLADGAPAVGRRKTFWRINRIFLQKLLYHGNGK